MKWKFWQRNGDPLMKGTSKLPGPKNLPERVGRYMVVSLGMDPDDVWSLKAVTRPFEGLASRHAIRIFNPASTDHAGITIRDYDSLEIYQEMILFDGWFDKKSNQIEITTKNLERPTAA